MLRGRHRPFLDKGIDLNRIEFKFKTSGLKIKVIHMAAGWPAMPVSQRRRVVLYCTFKYDIDLSFPVQDRDKLIEQLVNHGADINDRASDGATPLAYATECTPSLLAVVALLRHGADPTIPNDVGRYVYPALN